MYLYVRLCFTLYESHPRSHESRSLSRRTHIPLSVRNGSPVAVFNAPRVWSYQSCIFVTYYVLRAVMSRHAGTRTASSRGERFVVKGVVSQGWTVQRCMVGRSVTISARSKNYQLFSFLAFFSFHLFSLPRLVIVFAVTA